MQRVARTAPLLSADSRRLIHGRPGRPFLLSVQPREGSSARSTRAALCMASTAYIVRHCSTKMSQRTFPDDALPPESTYESRESLLASINSWAKPRGYAFTTGKSSKTPNGRIKAVFACDRNKLPPSAAPAERIRRTSSRRTGCKFSVLAKQSLDGSTWVLSHRPDKECALHNHLPSQDASAHPAHRQLEERDSAIISSLTNAGAAPRDIRTFLHNNSDALATQQDVYNRIAATRRDLREGQSSIQALVDQLNKEGF